mgnify:CR=1 FL=1
MNRRQAAIVIVLAVVAVGVATLPVSGASDQATNRTTENETDMGTQLTAFLQSSAAETNDTVESGMWAAGFERANESEQARLATDRTTRIEQRLERLQERNRTLQERYENGEIPEPAYVAQTSQLAGQIAALRSSVDDTASAAQTAGVNLTGIERLRDTVRNVTTPEVPGVARGIASGGPPAHAGPGGEDNDTERGPPAHAGPDSDENDTERGPPAHAGPDGEDDDDENETEDDSDDVDDDETDGDADDDSDDADDDDDEEETDDEDDSGGPPEHANAGGN